MQRIVIIGGGFAGLWSAAGAARKLAEAGVGADKVEVVLVNPDAFHGIRVRFYETDLSRVRVPLDQVLAPIGVRRIEGRVEGVDFQRREIDIEFGRFSERLAYDRLVLAAGSQLCRPQIPGLAEHAASVDTYWDAKRLGERIADLANWSDAPGAFTAVVIGAGLTGIETACELPDRLRACAPPNAQVRVVLADHSAQLGSTMGDHARPIILEALAELGVESRPGVEVAAIDRDGVILASGERIDARIVVWTAGMRASPLTALFPVERDSFGRLPVDAF
ncbi:MAG TPA: FAD-dependent oxidoreductase, partial [Pirellulales bacterium]|nr:FAD-dependent oxidoreductase [Pirellulales bacterium]